MNCPYCGFKFGAYVINREPTTEDVAAILCENCEQVGFVVFKAQVIVRATASQLEDLKKSRVWPFIEQSLAMLREVKQHKHLSDKGRFN